MSNQINKQVYEKKEQAKAELEGQVQEQPSFKTSEEMINSLLNDPRFRD